MNLITLKNYSSIFEAEAKKAYLESCGLKVMLRKNNMFQSTGDIAGAEILILEQDFEKAQELLNR